MDNDRINLIIPLIDTRFCLARLVAYQPVSSVNNDIVIGASGLRFVAWAGQSGQCRRYCHVSSNSKLCCPKFVRYTCVGVAQAQSRGDNSSDGRVVRISASRAADSDLISSRVKSMTLKLIFITSLIEVQHKRVSVRRRTSRQVY